MPPPSRSSSAMMATSVPRRRCSPRSPWYHARTSRTLIRFKSPLEQRQAARRVLERQQCLSTADARSKIEAWRVDYNLQYPSVARRLQPPSTACLKTRSEEHTSELQSQSNLVCRLLLEKKKKKK